MLLNKIIVGVVASFVLVSNVFANSFGVPERPSNISPGDAELLVSVSPILNASDFVIKDDGGNVLENSVLTESEWLVYENTGVTLVGGTNLGGVERDYSDTVFFDVSSSNLSLSGPAVNYAYVNHKRLELRDSSHGLLGYVELPNLVWQAENKDKYLAARFIKYENAVVVEWSYGDSSAGTPWELQLQAVLNDGLIGLKINQTDFTSGFVAAYGSEGINLCDENSCFSHSFSNIYNAGNAITCSLSLVGDSCSGATLYSGVLLDNLSITEIAHGTSLSSTYNLSSALNTSTEYYWVTRQKGTLNDGSEISGGWSNETKFTTEGTLNVNDIHAEITPSDNALIGQSGSVEYVLRNDTGADLDEVWLQVYSHDLISNNAAFNFPSDCVGAEGSPYYMKCTFSLNNGESKIFNFGNMEFSEGVSLTSSIAMPLNDGNPLQQRSLDWNMIPSTPSFSFDLVRNSENIANTFQNFTLSITNNEAKAINNVEFKTTTIGGSDQANGEGCFLQDMSINLVCRLGAFEANQTKEITFNMMLNNQSESEIQESLLLGLCYGDYGLCWPFIKTEDIAISIAGKVVDPVDPEGSGDPEDPAAGSMIWLLPLLGLFLRRKRMK